MNIYDFAIQMEKDAESFYREQAGKTKKAGFKNILNMLADDEVKHGEIFKKLKDNETLDMEETKILGRSKNIFQQMKDEDTEIIASDEEVDLYTNAREVELKGIESYKDLLKKVKDKNHKALLERIIDEEKRHFHLLDNLVELLLRPKQWIETGEFIHLEDY